MAKLKCWKKDKGTWGFGWRKGNKIAWVFGTPYGYEGLIASKKVGDIPKTITKMYKTKHGARRSLIKYIKSHDKC